MKQPTRITLVRHGETEWNREGRLQGSQDIPLSEAGLRQAERIAQRLKHEPYHRVYSSTLQRAHKTAERIAQAIGVPHHVHDQLHERPYGEVEGMTRDEILARYPDFWAQDAPPAPVPGLETLEQLRERARKAVQEIADRHPGENLLIVSHGGTINAFLHAISSGAYGTGINRLGNTSLTETTVHPDGRWCIDNVGCTAHLSEEDR